MTTETIETGNRTMTTETTENENKNAITTNNSAAENIRAAAREDAAFDRMLKFRKGEYFIGEDSVALGTEYLAHAAAWTKAWTKFVDGKPVDQKPYRVALGEKPPQREELDTVNESDWPIGRDGKRSDPWAFQYLLPLENMINGEVVVFATQSIGGRQAVTELCDAWSERTLKGQDGQPIIQLAVGEMPTKKFGKVPRPLLEVVGWDDADVAIPEAALAAAIPVKAKKVAAKHDDMDDEIPF